MLKAKFSRTAYSAKRLLAICLHRIGIRGVFYSDVVELERVEMPSQSVLSCQTIIPAQEIALNDSANALLIKRSPFFSSGIYPQRKVFICELEKPRLNVKIGLMATREYQLIAESDFSLERLQQSTTRLHTRVRPAEPLSGYYTTLWSPSAYQYYHWMLECLPRTYVLSQWRGEMPQVIMPVSMAESFKKMVGFCIPPQMPIVYSSQTWVQPERFVFCSPVTRRSSAYLPNEVYEYLQRCFIRGLEIKRERKYFQRIFISRLKAPKRRLLNEAQVMDYLAPLGFESYCLEDMSLEAQVQLFYDAEFVVAPHGAGMSNLLFAGRDTKVVELFNTESVPTFFYLLAKSIGQNYLHVFARHCGDVGDDFEIDIDDLKTTVRRLI